VTRIVLVRHGETEHNRGQLTLGRADIALNARGRLQARALAASFAQRPAAIYTSPLSRCRDTAEVIGRATATSVTVDEALIEMDVGEMEHLTRDQLREQYPDFIRQWLGAGVATARMPGGETLAEVQERGWAALERIVSESPDGGEVVVITHNFVLLTIACHALGLPSGQFRRLKAGLASKGVLEMTGSAATLISWNDTAHLRARGLG
jgi:probable phosphoglycerate mutase